MEKRLDIPYSEFKAMEDQIETLKNKVQKLSSDRSSIEVISSSYHGLNRVILKTEYLSNEKFQERFGYIPDRLNELEKLNNKLISDNKSLKNKLSLANSRIEKLESRRWYRLSSNK